MMTVGDPDMTKLIVAFRNFANAPTKKREREPERDENVKEISPTHSTMRFRDPRFDANVPS